jgi:hypothetical protein
VNGNRPAPTDACGGDPKSRRLLEVYYRASRAGLAGGFTEGPERVALAAVRTAICPSTTSDVQEAERSFG